MTCMYMYDTWDTWDMHVGHVGHVGHACGTHVHTYVCLEHQVTQPLCMDTHTYTHLHQQHSISK